ncbi:hypothetical protein DL96DRAFT_1614937 [Flagelloscypha sp. PMI_526]|nr:hypothetical protein DL96DRAFT_1614937 [Flagelloscypha sp. PMI_526]
MTGWPQENRNNGVKQGVTGVTSTLGNAVGGIVGTVGGVVGSAGRGLGSTVNSTTGTKPVGDALASLTDGVEKGAKGVQNAVEDAGKWPGK